jgi:Carboxypeptidase regulatory-like domain
MLRKPGHILLCSILILAPCACTPKKLVTGRVLDAETGRPIEGAVVAIRWLQDRSDDVSDGNDTLEATQDFSDQNGTFRIPQYPGKPYVMGVYKKGYVCWSSRDKFLPSEKNAGVSQSLVSQPVHVDNGMAIQLKPFKNEYRRDEHAGFTMQVAGAVADNPAGPFQQAIKSEFELWRNDLRQDFEEAFGKPLQSPSNPPGAR